MNDNPITNPAKAIRAFCLNCVGESAAEVRLCPSTRCALHPFRFGKNPYRVKREMTEAQREAAALRLAKARERTSGVNNHANESKG